MKDKGVCKGCKYYKEDSTTFGCSICDFLEMTGKSRIVIEIQNGGIKHDSCICYEEKKRKNAVGWQWRKH